MQRPETREGRPGCLMLSEVESSRLRVKEHAIERGAQQVGEALRDIRNEHLYRATHATFEDYCQERWSIGRDYANRQITAVEVTAILEPMGSKIPERQTRELRPLLDDPDRMREVWQAANDATGGKPTAAAIRAARDPEPVVPDEVVDAEIVEIVENELQPEPRRITGTDGKFYSRDASKPRRRPFPDAYWHAIYELQKSVKRIERLHADDRFLAHREAVHEKHWRQVLRATAILDSAGYDLDGLNKCGNCDERMLPAGEYETRCVTCRDGSR